MPKYKPKKKNPNALKWRKVIDDKVRQGIRNGASLKQILDRIAHYQEAPHSTATLYKIYGESIAEERGDFEDFVGTAVRQKIQEGDSKIIEFTARSKLGWNPSVRVEDVSDSEDEDDKDAISRLASLLGRDQES